MLIPVALTCGVMSIIVIIAIMLFSKWYADKSEEEDRRKASAIEAVDKADNWL